MNDEIKKMMDSAPEPKFFEQGLTQDEVKMFGKIASMEEVHNAIGKTLGDYKDQIVTIRNDFVARMSSKYRLQTPAEVAYDPLSQKIVSVFHPNLKAHKMVSSGNAFETVASEMTIDLLRALSKIHYATKK